MQRQLLSITIAIGILTVTGACDRTPHDRAYYLAHPDEAKEKLDACNKSISLSMTDAKCAAVGNALETIHEKARAKRQSIQKHKEYSNDSWMFN